MNKQTTHSYKGMNQDLTQSTFPNDFYFEGRNIRIVATDTQTTGSITNEKGNEFILTIPTPVIDYETKTIFSDTNSLVFTTEEISSLAPDQSAEQYIIGHSINRDYIILFTTDNVKFDCIWKLSYDTFNIELLYLRSMNFNVDSPIDVVNNFENEKIDKIYWINGNEQLRLLNVNHSILNGDLEELIDLPINTLTMVGKYSLSEPKIVKVEKGGNHTSGMIQYAYNLYRLNSSQTQLSPLSELIPLDKKEIGGGDLNEIVGAIPVIKIEGLDTNYTHIKVYAIKYTSYNEVPSISVITEEYIPDNGEINIFDDGSIINSISLEEFLLIGSNVIIPKHINSKFNRLFFANFEELNFEVKLDTRAYSFPSIGDCLVYNNSKIFEIGDITPNINGLTGEPKQIVEGVYTDDYDEIFDSVNLDYDVNKYQSDRITIGGEGKYVSYELIQDNVYNNQHKYFKDEEVYRIAIQFYNKYGQISNPNWIADFKSREGNLQNNYNKLKVTLKSDFYEWISLNFSSDYEKPIGYKILVAKRDIGDRTIVANGIVGTMLCNDNSGAEQTPPPYVRDKSQRLPKLPNILLRNCNSSSTYGTTAPLKGAENLMDFYYESYSGENPGDEAQFAYFVDRDTSGRSWQFNSLMQLYSPEIIFKKTNSLNNNLRFKIKGALKNSYNSSWIKESHTAGDEVSECKVYDGLSPHRNGGPTKTVQTITGSAGNCLSAGLIGHPTGSDPNHYERMLFYRNYGDLNNITDNYTVGGTVLKLQNPLVCPTTDSNITLSGLKKLIRAKLGDDDPDAVVTGSFSTTAIITVTPTNLLDVYDFKLCRDINGFNIVGTPLIGVSGIQSITVTTNFTPSQTTGTKFKNVDTGVIIESNSAFTATVDANVKIYHSDPTSVLTDECDTLLNPVMVGPSTSPSGIYYTPSVNKVYYNTYGAPEITEVNQTFKSYNDDVKLRYTNTLESFITDGDSDWKFMDNFNRAITSINCTNNRCATFALNYLGAEPFPTNPVYRPTLEQLYVATGITGNDNGIIGEFFKTNEEIYLGGIYGGNSYEAKKRTDYIEIGEYKSLQDASNLNIINDVNIISSPGDTFVQKFRFLRIIRKDKGIIATNIKEYEEIVEYLTETTVDLKNRSDLSLNNWDSSLVYLDSDYHSYNKVYSQQSDLIVRKNNNFNFKKINKFDTTIIVSKVKTNNEIIDNWTDLLLNETITFDGKYGSINALHNFKDELYILQDSATAFLSVLPRVQVQSSDGIGIELGQGDVLQRYRYISIENGTKNRWSLVNSPNAFYFYDLLNNTIQICSGGEIAKISDLKGIHTYLVNNTDKQSLMLNNPSMSKGVVSSYDYINNEVFFTFLQDNKLPFTINYSEVSKSFVSFYDYIPNRYISRGNHFLAIDSSNNRDIYRQYAGEYNKFFGQYYPSYVTLNVNPDAALDCVFDNINFKSEVYLNDVDQVDNTLTKIQAYNDYQDSGLVPLTNGRNNNLRRKFRDWNALIPRESNTRKRIRAPWIKLKLQFDNNNNYKFVLHNVNIYYTV